MADSTRPAAMSEIVRTVARLLKGLILLYGVYLVLYGHITPGGGFAGGVVIACAFILLTIANGAEHASRFFNRGTAAILDTIGVFAVLMLASIGGWWLGDAFFTNFIETPVAARFSLFSAGIVPIANVGIGIKVASSLFLVFSVLAALRTATDGDAP